MSDTLWIKPSLTGEPGQAIPWARSDRQGHILARGADPLEQLPRGLPCRVVLPAGQVSHLRLVLPGGKRLTGRALAFALEDQLADEPEAIHAVAGEPDAQGGVSVAVVERAAFARLLGALEAAGLAPQSVRAEPDGVAPAGGEWRLVWSDVPFLRAAGQPTLLPGNTPDDALAFLGLALARAGQRPDRLVLRVDPVHPLPEAARWQDRLGLPVVMGPAYDWAAAQATAQNGPELLRDDFSRGPRLKLDARAWRPAAWLALALLLVNGAGALAGAGMAAWEARQLARENATLFRAAFPEAQVVVDPVLQMQRKLADLRHAAGESAAGDFLPMLARAGQVLPAPARQAAREIRHESGRLTLLLPAGQAGVEGADWSRAGLRATLRPGADPAWRELTLENAP